MLNEPFYVYRHIRPDTNQVFYIGKGNDLTKGHAKRHLEKHGRNIWWHRIVKKNNGNYGVEIMYRRETESEINKKEVEFIQLYGRMDLHGGTLCNLTDGGEGTMGVIISDDAKNKLRELFSGEGHPNWGKKLSIETCRRKSESMKNSPFSLKGKKLPDWWKDKIRQTKFGENNPMYGKKSHLSKPVVDIITGERYESIMDAATHTPYQFQYVSAMLKGDKPNKTNLRYANGL